MKKILPKISPEVLETEADVETQENDEEIQEPEPEPTPPPKWKPNISYSPAPFKFKKPKTTVAPMKSNFIDLKANVDQVRIIFKGFFTEKRSEVGP